MPDGTRVSIYLDEELVARIGAVRAAGLTLNVSRVAQDALRCEVERLEPVVRDLLARKPR